MGDDGGDGSIVNSQGTSIVDGDDRGEGSMTKCHGVSSMV